MLALAGKRRVEISIDQPILEWLHLRFIVVMGNSQSCVVLVSVRDRSVFLKWPEETKTSWNSLNLLRNLQRCRVRNWSRTGLLVCLLICILSVEASGIMHSIS